MRERLAGGPGWPLLCMAAALAAALAWRTTAQPRARQVDFRPTVRSLERLAQIVSLKVNLADTLSVDAREGMDSVRAAWIVKGDALIGVDVSAARIEGLDAEGLRAEIVLPGPAVISPRVDHGRTRTFMLRSGLWTRDRYVAGIKDRAMHIAQDRIAEQAADAEHIEMARARVETIVREFYGLAGWDVQVRWLDSR